MAEKQTTYWTATQDELFFLLEDERGEIVDQLAWDPASGHGDFSEGYLTEQTRNFPSKWEDQEKLLEIYLRSYPLHEDEVFKHLSYDEFLEKLREF